MDPLHVSDDDEEASAAAMAAAMGFSSFGTQGNPTKKRKFNAATDAFVEGQELASLDKGGKKGQGSGGNTIPLGKPRVFGSTTTPAVVAATSNEEEISLDEEEDGEGPNYIDTSLPPPVEMERSRERETQDMIDALLASIQPAISESATPQQPQGPLGYGDATFMQGYARSDAASTASSSRPSGRAHGQRNELWYVGYYDPSFNENPWAKLEKEKGLVSRGSWLERERR